MVSLGNAPPATKSMAEPIYEKLELARIEWWQWEVQGWLESLSASTVAAAGARVSSGRGYNGRGDAGLARMASTRCGEYVGRMPGIKWSPKRHRRRARAVVRLGSGGGGS